jgi:hypothetical protein
MIMEINEIVTIRADKYWEIFNDICNQTPEDEWWLVNRDVLDERFFGLRHCKHQCEHQSVVPWEIDKTFRITNKQKFLWIKLKYGI